MRTVSGASFRTLRKELDSVHPRHAHVGDDDPERPLVLNQQQGSSATHRRGNLEILAEQALIALEQDRFVIHEKNFVRHNLYLSPCR